MGFENKQNYHFNGISYYIWKLEHVFHPINFYVINGPYNLEICYKGFV